MTEVADRRQIIRPQAGPQELFASTDADIAFFGGAAGGGKSFALLMAPLPFFDRKGFGGVIFRRTYPEITNEGGLWDTSEKLYPHIGAVGVQSATEWRFPSGVTISFAHMQHEKDKHSWQGSAIPFIGFDEVTHFTRGQFFYMISRNRLTHNCGVRPYIRATCNPDPDSWVAEFISWWINQDTGFPIPERSGVKRWFVRDGDHIIWADSAEELDDPLLGLKAKSVTFIASKLNDNAILMKQDPGYLSNLHSMPMVDRMRLLEGNWKVRAVQGMFFQRAWFGKTLEASEVPSGGKTVRYWDRAATEQSQAAPDPDWTAGVKMRRVGSTYYVMDVVHLRGRPEMVLQTMKKTAVADGRDGCEIIFEQDPAAAGKAEINMLFKEFAGYHVSACPVHKKKPVRARPFSSQAEAGNIKVVRGAWNEVFFGELESFADWDEVETKPAQMPHDDIVDAAGGAFRALANNNIAGRGGF